MNNLGDLISFLAVTFPTSLINIPKTILRKINASHIKHPTTHVDVSSSFFFALSSAAVCETFQGVLETVCFVLYRDGVIQPGK